MSVLHAVRHRDLVTASEAVAWFAGGHAGPGDVIGYLFSAGQAEWFRCAGGVAHGPEGPLELGEAYEVFATSGARQLRWVQQADGRGQPVCLSEDVASLPSGEPVGGDGASPRRRLEATVDRILAGRVIRASDGWVTLATARYPSCEVPVTASPGQEVRARLAEYAVQDGHGNVSVVDSLLVSLTGRNPAQDRKEHRP